MVDLLSRLRTHWGRLSRQPCIEAARVLFWGRYCQLMSWGRTRAGTPPMRQFFCSKRLFTTGPTATTHPSGMVAPFRTITRLPIQTCEPMTIDGSKIGLPEGRDNE